MARLGRGQPNRPYVGRAPTSTVRSGSVTLAGPTGLATGRKGALGVATGAGPAVTTASVGHKAGAGTASVTLTVTAAASGYKSSGVGTLPRASVRWQFVVGPATGGYSLSLTHAKARNVTFRLTEPSSVDFSLDGRDSQALSIHELSTDIHTLWTDESGTTYPLFRGRIGPSGDDVSADGHQTTFSALDYRALLVRRILYTGATLTYTGVDQSAIAWALINYTQGLPGGNLGISRGIGQTTGQNRDRTYELRDKIGERIQELSEVINGFDWDVIPIGSSALQFDVHYPSRGSYKGVVLEYGGLASRITRSVDTADYANAIGHTGADLLTAVETSDPDIALLPEGRWDAVFGDTSLINQASLNERAAWQLAESQVVRPVYTVTLRRGAWKGPNHIWLGDGCRIIPRSGRLRQVNTVQRVFEISVSIEGDASETVELTLGGPKPDYRRYPTTVDRRLTNLERR